MGNTLIHRAIILVIILLCSSFLSISQKKDSLSYSAISTFGKEERRAVILHSDQKTIVAKPNIESTAVSFSVYDSDSLTLLDEFSWKSDHSDKRNFEVKALDYFQDKILILSGLRDRKSSTEYLWLSTVSTDGQMLYTMEVEQQDLSNMTTYPRYELFKSESENYVAVSAVNEINKGNQFEIKMFIYDRSLVNLTKKTLAIPNIKKVSFPGSFTLSDEGSIYFLNGLQDVKGEEVDKIGLDKRLYQLFRYDPIGEKLKQYDVSIADKYISDVKMKINLDGNLVILGFYNNTYQKGAEGLFTMVINNEDGSVELSGKKSFNSSVLIDFKSEKQIRKNPVIYNLFLDDFFFSTKGNIVLLAEVFNLEHRLIQNANRVNISMSSYYNFENILALEIEDNLSYVRHHTIHKRQKSINYFNPHWGYSILNPSNTEELKVVYNYVSPKTKKSASTVISELKTSVWCQRVFSTEPQKIHENKNLKVAPRMAPFNLNNMVVLQDQNKYNLVKLIPVK